MIRATPSGAISAVLRARWKAGEGSDPPAFAAHARGLSLRVARVWLPALMLLALPWWSIDWLVYSDPAVLAGSLTWRAAISALLALLSALLWRADERWLLRHLHGLALLAATSAGFIVGAGQGLMGGVELPSFAGIYLLPFAGLVFTGPLRVRIAATAALLGAALLGYFAPFPEHLRHPHVAMVFGLSLFAGATAVLIGHAITLLLRRNFEQALLLAARSELLEEQVAARTRELRRLAAHIDGAREEERRRISRELHDDLGGLLTLLGFELDAAARAGSPARAREILDQASAALRTVVLDLRPPVLDQQGLVPALQWLCERHEETTGVACAWSVELDERELGEREKTALFRMLQEALTNAARHARATEISVDLRGEAGALCLVVTDDGVGFAPAQVVDARLGLLGMRERARRLGGVATIASQPGEGTRIEIRLPRGAREDAA